VLAQNLRLAARSLAKAPSFTIVVVLVLALGIGANTAIFSVVYAALLRPLPFREPSQLMRLGESRQQYDTDITRAEASNPDFLDWQKRAHSFQSLAAYGGDAFTLSVGGEPENTFAAQVTPNFFATLGVQPILGRDFVEGEDQADGPHVAILAYNFWRSRFGGAHNIVGQTIRLDGNPVTVVGVLPGEFDFAPANSPPLWVPIHQTGDPITRRSLRWLRVVGRLASNIRPEQARAEMNAITAQLAREYPKEDASTYFVSQILRENIVGKVQPILLVLLGAVGFLLLITCANVANLLMTRAVSRRKEFAVRLAMGASRTSLFLKMLLESLLLSVAGSIVGLLAALWSIQLLVSAMPEKQLQAMPFLARTGINLPVFGFLTGITVLTAALFGLAPGLTASKAGLNEVLKVETRGGTGSGHNRFRQVLVVSEIAVSLVLLVGAGLMLKSVRALLHQNPGYDLHNVLTFSVNLPNDAYPGDKNPPFNNPSALRFEHEFVDKLRALPGVVDAASTGRIPANGGSGTIRFVVEGRLPDPGHETESDIVSTGSEFFSAMRIPLLSGRLYGRSDIAPAPPVLVVNQAFANRYFPGEDPVGRRIRFTYSDKNPFLTIVGVVGDTAQIDLASPHPPLIYGPNDRSPNTFLSFLVRTKADPKAFLGAAHNALGQMDPQLPMIQAATIEQIVEQSPSVFLRRYPSYLINAFAALALVLATIGLYGLISFGVLQRTREIGIRVALGAQRADILQGVFREGLVAVGLGVGFGVAASLGLTRLMTSLLYGVTPHDWGTFILMSVGLALVALAACAIPAMRATHVDPIIALRYE
jgi:predicted permease